MNANIELAQDERIAKAIADHKNQIPWRRKHVQRFVKRVFDVIAAAPLLLLLSPVMMMVGVLVRVTSKGLVLLAQTRIGLDGVPYRMYKFRSMVADSPDGFAEGSGEVTGSDERLTPIGGWLRAWRLDELPQLVHVLSGKMSLVGPRPDIPINLDFYTPEQMLRFAMPPGCTAWTFTRGVFQNDWSTRQDINVDYVRRWSLWLDVKILVGTLVVLLAQKNTVPESNAVPRSRALSPGVAEGRE